MINEILEYMQENDNRNPKHKDFKIDKSLTKIILPRDKLNMFIDWFNTDIKYQNYIPQAFNEGYLEIENDFLIFSEEKHKEDIKATAKEFHATYNQVKNAYLELLDLTKKAIIYFKFADNIIDFFVYINGKEFSYSNFNLKTDKFMSEDILKEIGILDYSVEDMGKLLVYNLFCIFITVMWYLATSRNTKKYQYEINRYSGSKNEKDKKIVKVNSLKKKTTPICDLSKIRTVKVDKLIQHRKGWTYSHSFAVSGHFRHYKNGKTIFVKSFIKGKNKEQMVQNILLEPKEINNG